MRSRRRSITWGLLAATAFILAASPFDSQAGRGTIEGRVLNADRTPAPGVHVIAWESPDAKGVYPAHPVAIGVTDTEGRYRLSDVSPGRCKVFANADWFNAHNPQGIDALPVVTVRSGVAAVHNIDLPPLPSGVAVSGRVMGDILNKDLQAISLSSGDRSFQTDVDFDGSFTFRGVPPGSYAVTSPLSPLPFLWASSEVNVADRDIAGLELAPPGETLPIMGRVVVDGGGPVPSFSFALEGRLGFAHAVWVWVTNTVRSGGNYTVTGWADRYDDVIFSASLPIGLYRIAVGVLPPGYRVKSFTYGSTNLLENPINVTGKLEQLSITLIPPTASHVRKIRGRLIRDAALPTDVAVSTVRLSSRLLRAEFDVPVARDGSFEISGMPPGGYGLNVGGLDWKVTVPERGVEGLEFRMSRILAIRTEMSRRQPYSSVPSSRIPGRPETASQEREITGRLHVEEGSPPSLYLVLKPSEGRETTIFFMGSTVSQKIPVGTYRVAFGGLDNRYQIQSLTYGDADLRKDFLRITADSTPARELSVGLKQVGRIGDADVEHVEMQRLPPSSLRTVQGRIAVERGLPLPVLAITVRPNVDTAPPYLHPYTWRSRETRAGANVLSNGRFFVDLPEGRHRLRVDAYPESAYRLKSVKYGSTELVDGYVEVDGSNLKDLVITVASAPDSSWKKVRGRVTGLENIQEPIRVALLGTNTLIRIEAIPTPNGSFEFPKVPPDTYTLLTVPRVSRVMPQTGVVIGRESPFLNLSIPRQHRVAIQRKDASPITGNLILKVSETEAYTVLSSVVLKTAGEMVCIGDVCSTSYERFGGSPTIVSTSPDRKSIVLSLAEGEYRMEGPGTAADLEVRSLSGGSVRLTQNTLVISSTPEDGRK